MEKLDIINKALLRCGLPLAATLNDCDWNAALVFDAAGRTCLRKFAWNFATEFVSLGQGGAPAFGFTKGYSLPADFLRALDVHCVHDLRSPRARYQISGRKLYTQVAPCYLRYIKDVPCEDWPDDFCDVVSCRIAWEIAPLSAQTQSMAPLLAQEYQTAMADAQATDARETAERVPQDINIYMARAGMENVGRRV